MTKTEAGEISKAELARHLGVTRSRISALVKRGLPVRPDGKIILADAVKWMKANCEQSARFQDRGVNKLINADAGPEPAESTALDAAPEPAESAALDDDNSVLPYSDAKALRETYLARMARLEFLAKSGRLLDADEVQSVWTAHLTDCRKRLLTVPSRCGARIAHLSRAEVDVIDREIRDALMELAGGEPE
jgi:phage terminase Nu1 subunit (DNA packaging protein)